MRRFIFFIVFMLLVSNLYGQIPPKQGGGNFRMDTTTYKVIGQVINDAEAPIPYASIAIFRVRDSSMVNGGVTDDNGRFEIRNRMGRYYATVSFLSHETVKLKPFFVRKANIDLGTITLKQKSTNLSEVTIEAEKPQMELKLDKRVFNVGSDVNNKGANAAEVLDNIPSITVDVDGNVALRGSENVTLLIDGKPSGLVGLSSTDALRQLQGDLIEKVEVVTNPSARYDAEGEVGIINIVLKKSKRSGLNGSIDVTIGHPANYGLSISMNYRVKKFNYFGSYGVSFRESPGSGSSFDKFILADTSYSTEREREHTRGGLSNNIRLGAEYFINSKNSITVSGLARISKGENDADINYIDFGPSDEFIQKTDRDENEDENRDVGEVNLNYSKLFDTKEHKWSTDFKYTFTTDEESSVIEEFTNDVFVLSDRVDNRENEDRFLFQSDYIKPIGDDGKFETGIKGTYREIDNKFLVEQTTDNAVWTVLDDFNNRLLYEEGIYAAYIMYGNKKKRFSYQFGLRGEYSDVSTNLVKTNELNQRDYFDLFPSSHFSYEFKNDNTVQLSYSRRIMRPRFWYLLPFFTYSDSRNTFSGNPNLDPEFTHSTELGYLMSGKKGSLLSSVYYRYTDGNITRIRFADSSGVSSSFPVNLGNEESYGLEFAANYRPAKEWNFSANYNFYRSIEDGSYEGVSYDSDTYSWTSRMSARYMFKRKLSLQTSFNFRSPRESIQGEYKASYSLDAGASIDVLDGKGTISLNGRDLLNSRKRKYDIIGDNFITSGEFQWRSRSVNLNFNYRINQQKRRSRGGNFNGGFDDGGGGGM